MERQRDQARGVRGGVPVELGHILQADRPGVLGEDVPDLREIDVRCRVLATVAEILELVLCGGHDPGGKHNAIMGDARQLIPAKEHADACGGLFLVPDHRGAPAKTGDNDLARLQFVLTYSFVTLAV